MKRLIVEPMPDVPAAARFFRCPACRAVTPETAWSEMEVQRYLRDGRETRCDACYTPEPADAGMVWDEGD